MPSDRPSWRVPRAPFVFVLGLSLAAGAAVFLDGAAQALSGAFQGRVALGNAEISMAERAPLTPREKGAAQAAWRYFEAHTRPETGFVDAVADFPSATLWDQGSYLLALVSARRLGLVSQGDFDARVHAFVASLAELELYEGLLPNKVYDTQRLTMVNYANEAVAGGVGWSALDIARLLMGLRVIEKHFPQHGAEIRDVLAGWDLASMAQKGELIGVTRAAGAPGLRLQEGRIGYEQYGARAAALWGLDVVRAMSAERIVAWRDVEGVEIPTDLRRASNFGAITPVLSEPYLLLALELGLDAESRALAERVFQAQKARYAAQGIITMVSEDHLDEVPHFAYSSVSANGRDWAVIAEDGSFHEAKRTLSTKAAFGWAAIFDAPYAHMAREEVIGLAGAEGFPAGIYERDGRTNTALALNTNAVILEALHYQVFGPLRSLR
ncbi:MAG: DUF3131 domain-containing protein [Pseudomonadota bacterium]